jgi:hypothetical protein
MFSRKATFFKDLHRYPNFLQTVPALHWHIGIQRTKVEFLFCLAAREPE